jgi:hypothetical protein
MPRLIVIIVVAFDFSLKRPWGFSSLTILFYYRSRYLVHLIKIAFLFLRRGNVLLFGYHAFRFLRPAPEVIV